MISFLGFLCRLFCGFVSRGFLGLRVFIDYNFTLFEGYGGYGGRGSNQRSWQQNVPAGFGGQQQHFGGSNILFISQLRAIIT